jgi:adenylate kinase family enzyme
MTGSPAARSYWAAPGRGDPERRKVMRRVLILGCCGAGKSTLSRRLAAMTGLPLISLDSHYWRPGWVATPRDEWNAAVTELCGRPAWIMDGNSHGTLSIRLPRADTAIWLDYPRLLCLRRVLWRVARHHGTVREDMGEGCAERFDLEFLRYVWNFNARNRPRLVAALEACGAHLHLHRLQGDGDAERLLQKLSGERAEIPDVAAGQP